MKGKTLLVGLSLLLAPFALKAEGGKSQILLADPYILLDGDTYYAYGTQPDGYVNYVKGANVAGFMKVAKAMMAQGIV